METKTTNNFEKAGNRIPFDVPENYFEEFAARIDTLTGERHTPFKRMLKPWLYMAAMFTALLFAGNVLLNIHKSNRLEQSEDYEAYLISQLNESAYYDYYFSVVAASEEATQEVSN